MIFGGRSHAMQEIFMPCTTSCKERLSNRRILMKRSTEVIRFDSLWTPSVPTPSAPRGRSLRIVDWQNMDTFLAGVAYATIGGGLWGYENVVEPCGDVTPAKNVSIFCQ